jgi:hypothetical protein
MIGVPRSVGPSRHRTSGGIAASRSFHTLSLARRKASRYSLNRDALKPDPDLALSPARLLENRWNQ